MEVLPTLKLLVNSVFGFGPWCNSQHCHFFVSGNKRKFFSVSRKPRLFFIKLLWLFLSVQLFLLFYSIPLVLNSVILTLIKFYCPSSLFCCSAKCILCGNIRFRCCSLSNLLCIVLFSFQHKIKHGNKISHSNGQMGALFHATFANWLHAERYLLTFLNVNFSPKI